MSDALRMETKSFSEILVSFSNYLKRLSDGGICTEFCHHEKSKTFYLDAKNHEVRNGQCM